MAAYELAVLLYRKTGWVALNPLLTSIVLVCAVILIFRIDYADYNVGGEIITMFISPVTILLAVPLYMQLHVLKENGAAILTGIFLGCLTALFTMLGFAKLFGMDQALFVFAAQVHHHRHRGGNL